MKKYWLILFFIFSLNSFGQVNKYRSESVVEIRNTESGDKYSESKKANTFFVFDLKKRTITVTENGDRVFNIKKSRSYHDKDNNYWTRFNCENEKGEKMNIEIIQYAKPKNEVNTQIVIKDLLIGFLYNVNEIQN